MRKGEVKYKGEIMRQLSQKRWSHPRPLSFKEIYATLIEAEKEFPVPSFSIRLMGPDEQELIDYRNEIIRFLDWFKKWFGEV